MAAPTHQRTVSVEDKILSAATENKALLSTLQETDYAPAAIAQTHQYISTLQRQIKEKEAAVRRLDAARSKEQREHEKMRDSTMKRLAYRLGGKKEEFEQKAAKEEREYFEAVQGHFEESEALKRLQSDLREANQTLQELSGAAERHRSAQAQLDRLYGSIFDGPTPEFPQEDQVEHDVRQANDRYQDSSRRLNAENQVLRILLNAQKLMSVVMSSMQSASSASQADMFGFGGSFADMAERSALAKAQQGVSQIEMLMAQARELSPEVRDIGRMRIAEGNFMSDILFDNPWHDYRFHQKIEESMRQVMNAGRRLVMEVDNARGRCVRLKGMAEEEGRRLMEARERLQGTRKGVFESIAGGLPDYQA